MRRLLKQQQHSDHRNKTTQFSSTSPTPHTRKILQLSPRRPSMLSSLLSRVTESPDRKRKPQEPVWKPNSCNTSRNARNPTTRSLERLTLLSRKKKSMPLSSHSLISISLIKPNSMLNIRLSLPMMHSRLNSSINSRRISYPLVSRNTLTGPSRLLAISKRSLAQMQSILISRTKCSPSK